MKEKLSVGIHMESDSISWGFADKTGNLFFVRTSPTASFKDIGVLVHHISRTLQSDLLEFDKEKELVGIGITAPYADLGKGTVAFPGKSPWEGDVPVVSCMKGYFPEMEIVTGCITDAQATGEKVFGGAKEAGDPSGIKGNTFIRGAASLIWFNLLK